MPILAILLLVIFFGLLFVYVLPILLGILIVALINAISQSAREKFAPKWWNILAVAITLLSTILMNVDILNESADYGATPFIILLVFAVLSLLFMSGLTIAVKTKESKSSASLSTPQQSSSDKPSKKPI